MNVWMHKETGELAIARRIWLEEDFPEVPDTGYTIQFVCSTKNWAFENSHGVIMILPLRVQKYFEDLGEL